MKPNLNFRDNENSTPKSFDISSLPPIDRSRKIGVYIRQSGNGADNKNGESRETQLALIVLAIKLRGDNDDSGVIIYDEGAGKSGQTRIDERDKLQRLWDDMQAGLIGTVIVAREDRLFRDKHMTQSGTFTEQAERLNVVVIVPPLTERQTFRVYDFKNHSSLRAFQDKMINAYDYIEYHVGYMHLNQRRKAERGCYDGRLLPPGLAILRTDDKEEKRQSMPVLYEPWASIMQQIFKRAKQLSWQFGALIRELEQLPYVFPDIPEDDAKKYIIKTKMRKVPRGYKPDERSVRAWFTNVALIGCWQVDRKTGDTIVNNHPCVIKDRDLFEEGYIARTGYNLSGVATPERQVVRRSLPSRDEKEKCGLVLNFMTSPGATCLTIRRIKGTEYYEFLGMKDGDMVHRAMLIVSGKEIDRIVTDRVAALSKADNELADKIKEYFTALRNAQPTEFSSIDAQLKTIEDQIAVARARILDLGEAIDGTTLVELGKKIKELESNQNQLTLKRKSLTKIRDLGEIDKFYRVLRNFEERYAKLDLEEKQRLLRLLAKNAVLERLSPHWLKLTINWIGAISTRPDVTYIWRSVPATQDTPSPEEIEIIRRVYPACERHSDLLRLLPLRSWNAIERTASENNISRKRQVNSIDVPKGVTWRDISVFEDEEKAKTFVSAAIEECKDSKQLYSALWALNPDLKGLEERLVIHLAMETKAQPLIWEARSFTNSFSVGSRPQLPR